MAPDEILDDTEVVMMNGRGFALIATLAALILGAAPAAPPTLIGIELGMVQKVVTVAGRRRPGPKGS
jgi:hypothetical protein